METEQEQRNGAPWYARGKAWIIGAGALAAASLAVLGLGDRLFPADLEDVAKIESVDMIGQTSFKQFASKGLGAELPLEPGPPAAPGDARAIVSVVSVRPAGSTVAMPSDTPEVESPKDPSEVAPPSAPETLAPDTPTIPPASPATDSPDPPTTPPPTTAPASPEVTIPPAAVDLKVWTPPDAHLQTMLSDPRIEDFDFTETELTVSFLTIIEPSGAEGEELPPEEAVTRVAAALVDVESTTDDEGTLDPVGWTVAVNLTLEGLAGVPLLLTWSLDGVNVPEEWAAEKVTYRVVAGTPHDAGSAEIWVPKLKTAGEYHVNVKLKLASDGATTIAHGPPLSISIP